ncbi:Site-specific DNA recombinase [Catalinimonas alkaloidigena]|uniref:Site-specific DNA recombinase n=2 Tax=Catalinimonas alkaloidigena TaxID=1075417 RepID=A0A1G9UZW6_9BACT|nr:Site-specific DNA recombinase [Catalinimonas alkaloidigena]
MKYVLYLRVSTRKQGDSGLGLEAQQAILSHFYAGQEILAQFVEVASGKDVDNRPRLREALALCQVEKATLAVAKIDRLSRNTEQALALYRQLDERLESCDIPNLDKFTLTLFMAIADRERELIAIRTKAALDVRRQQRGEWRTGSEAYRSGAAALKGTAVIRRKAARNAHNRRAAAYIRQQRAQGLSWTAIAAELNAHGFTTPRGKAFHPVQVQRLWKDV